MQSLLQVSSEKLLDNYAWISKFADHKTVVEQPAKLEAMDVGHVLIFNLVCRKRQCLKHN